MQQIFQLARDSPAHDRGILLGLCRGSWQRSLSAILEDGVFVHNVVGREFFDIGKQILFHFLQGIGPQIGDGA